MKRSGVEWFRGRLFELGYVGIKGKVFRQAVRLKTFFCFGFYSKNGCKVIK